MKNKIFSVILSLVISFGLWLYVVTVISPESETTIYNVPVELVNTSGLDSKNLILVSDSNGLTVDLTLSGNRSDLSKITSSNVTVNADLSSIKQPGEYQLDCTVYFQSGTADVVEQDPAYITVVVAEQETKTIPVKVVYTGSVRDGYEADKDMTTMDHTTVTIKGPKDTVSQIEYAGITIDLTNRMTSFVDDYSLTLYGANGLPLVNAQYVTANVTEVSAVVQVYKVKTLTLNYVYDFTGSGLLENMATVTTSTKEVTLYGSDDALSKLGEQFADGQFTFTISIADYDQETDVLLTLPLPEGVGCKEEIRAYVQVPEMSTVEFTLDASQLNLEDLPEGLDAQILGKVVVQVRGPAEELEKIAAEDIRGRVDCSEITEDSTYAPVVYTVQLYEYMYVVQDSVSIIVTVPEA